MLRSLLLTALVVALPASAQLQTQAVYVVAQGAFGGNNANIVRVDPAAGTAATVLSNRAYTQGAEIIGDRLYLTAGSGTGSRVDVVSLATTTQVGQVTTGVINPRYLAAIGGNRALVTNQTYSFETPDDPYLSVLDLATNTVTSTIPVVRQPEGVTVAGGRAYVALGGFSERDELAVVDLATLAAPTYVELGCFPRLVFTDREDDVWAVCTSTVVVLDGATGAETARITPPEGILIGFAQEATYDPETQSLFALAASGVLRFDTAANAYAATIPVPGTSTASAVGYDAQRDRLYIGRPNDAAPFSAPGTVTVHDATGAQTAQYAAGIYPTYIAVQTAGTVSTEPVAENGAVRLGRPSPNPVAGTATVAVTLAAPGEARLVAYDALGRAVAVLLDATLAAGTHDVVVPAHALPAGVYVLRLTATGGAATERLSVAR